MAEINIKTIDGKPYLELPCYPGDTVYRVGPVIASIRDIKAYSYFTYELKVYEEVYNIWGITHNIDKFGHTLFTNPEDAEAYKRKLEQGQEVVEK